MGRQGNAHGKGPADASALRGGVQHAAVFEAFFRGAPDMMAILAPDARLETVNPAFVALAGYGEEALLGRSLLDFVADDDRQTVQDAFDAVLRGDACTRFESRWRCRDGSLRLLAWAVFADAARRAVFVSARDYTAVRATEDQLSTLWLAVEQTSQGIVVTDLDGRIEYANDAVSAISGYTAAEILGRNPRLFQSGQTPPAAHAELWAALARGETWQGEFINARKNGEVYVESARISPVRQPDGRITHYLAIKEDITERKRSSEAIRESKTLLQAVIDATPDWIFVKDSEHRFMLVNQQFAQALHRSPAELVGLRDVDVIPSTIRFADDDGGIEAIRADDDVVLAGGSIHRPHEKITFDTGETRVFDVYRVPLRDSSQVIRGCLCYRRDITEGFNKQQEQRLLETQLRQAQKMELIGHLTGGIAHDFNNILSAVFGYAELVQMSPEVAGNAQLALYVQEILQAGIRAKELVAQLLTFSQRREMASQAINAKAIVNEVAKLLRSTVPSSISIDCVLAGDLPEVLISPVQLHQILMNLGVNARDAINGLGRIVVRAGRRSLKSRHVCASCHQHFSGDYLMLSVRDSGSGIPADNLLSIFDPFFTTKDVGHGSGLGLSVLHGIVHSANGHVEVLTALGEGSEFRVYLPAHASPGATVGTGARPEPRKTRVRGTVMVVDDEASIVRFMTVLLENLGCRVIGLCSPSEALRVFQKDPHGIDLVLTDQTMPDLTGIDLACAMLAYRPDIPIILSTGYSNLVDEDAARRAGVRRLLLKPVPAKVLSDIVGEYLSVDDDEGAGPAN